MLPARANTPMPAPIALGDVQLRPRVDGKFLHVGGGRFLVKGVTYGTFAPDADGRQFPTPARVRQDFSMMAAAGLNTVRVYTPPTTELLDAAVEHGLRVMVGLPWAQHVAFLDGPRLAAQIRRDIALQVRQLAGHPGLLLFALGNEVPPSVVRWHGASRVERFLHDLYDEAKSAAPANLFTYVNFPPTDYLDLSFFDVCSFNVYLHREKDLRAYLARLQQIAGLKPLLLAEAGADSIREGPDGQASLTAMNLRSAFAEGACGSIAFAWTDEWWRGGHDVNDWAFGLVDRDRRPKPALRAVEDTFAQAPFSPAEQARWPRASVVVCAYNAADTMEDCMVSLGALTYPDYEVIVVNDGSKDATPDIVARYPWARLITVPNGGLSAARNIGLAEATGEIVAYTDADVRVDPDWLTYLVQPFVTSDVVGSGGPNVVPPEDPWIAQCVALAPGAPTHVMLDDRVAEHVPGCNMAFRRDALLAIGGFNPIYLRAGDDVDVCWRLQARGGKIGFAPAALVWHHHRSRVKAYWRQQIGYGEGEVWLQPHHPDKFAGGKMIWHGRIYSGLPFVRPLSRRRVHTGVWGTAPFPSVYHVGAHPLAFVVHSTFWQLSALTLALAAAAWLLVMGAHPIAVLSLSLGLGALAATIARCFGCAFASDIDTLPRVGRLPRWASRVAYRLMIAWLHIIQPYARLRGRLRGRLETPEAIELQPEPSAPLDRPLPGHFWRAVLLAAGGTSELKYWSETWVSLEDVLSRLMRRFQAARGGGRVSSDDGWRADRDLSVSAGRWARLDVRTLVEEHKDGKCLLRFALRLRPTRFGTLALVGAIVVLVTMTLVGHVGAVPLVAPSAAGAVTLLLLLAFWQTWRTTSAIEHALSGFAHAHTFFEVDGGRRRTRLVPRALWQTAAVLLVASLGGFQSGTTVVQVVKRQVSRAAEPQVATASPVSRLGLPGGLALAPNGDLYVANAVTDTVKRLRAGALWRPLTRAGGFQSTRVGTTVARFDDPGGVAIGPDGDLYIADSRNHRICRVERGTGVIVTVAGLGVAGYNGDQRPAAAAMLNTPRAIAVSPEGDLYIADTLNNRVRVVDHRTGLIETVAGDGLTEGAHADGVRDGGPATLAHLNWPTDLALTRRGDIFVADMRHNRIRRIDGTTGIITTVAGNGVFGDRGDGGPATEASLAGPSGLALASSGGNLAIYVADYFNNRVRVVLPDGDIESLPSGNALPVGAPSRLAYDPGGWLYVADTDRDRVTALRLLPEHRASARRPLVKAAT
ncbi:MAG: glycosyltransferase [Vicinamibacterales bacterium]